VQEQATKPQWARGRLGRIALWLLPVVVATPLTLVLSPGLIGLGSSHQSAPPEPASGADGPEPSAVEPPLAAAEELETTVHAALEPAPFEGVEATPVEPSQQPGTDADAEGAPPAFDCIIEPHQVIAIRSSVVGRIETLRVERSDFVEAGQILVELESGPEEAAVELAGTRARLTGHIEAREANLDLGERRRERAKQLFESNALSLDTREEVETQTTLAQLELKQAREDQRLASLELNQAMAILKRRTIHSPIDGVVTERLMSPGEVVDEETILKIAQIDPLRVEVILPSAWFGSIQPGTKAAVVPEVPGDRVHIASVELIDRIIDAASGTFVVRLELPNPDYAIPSGLNCQVRFLDE
jgi:RND family efflux transporter MFP subunit